jgi:hypothetical protein
LYENSLVLVKLKNYYHSQQKTVEIGFNIKKGIERNEKNSLEKLVRLFRIQTNVEKKINIKKIGKTYENKK